MIEIICAAIAAIATIVSASIAVTTKRQNKKIDERAERRARESRLSMDLMYASCALSLTTAKKLANMHTNGDVEEAMEAATKAQTAYQDFVKNEAAKTLSE